ncbi:MAG TPA: hypothetical protein VGD27_17945 [Longimicrobiales bacterium]
MARGFLLSLIVVCAACSSNEVVRACTEIGCSNGLAIEVSSGLQQAITVHVRSGTQTLHTFRCEPNQPCQAFVADQTPAQVTIVVDAPEGELSKTYQPEYRTNRPNGPDCPPECRQATVRLSVN